MTQNKPTILYKLKLFLLALLGYCCIFLMPASFSRFWACSFGPSSPVKVSTVH
jgi:hypothetical protein